MRPPAAVLAVEGCAALTVYPRPPAASVHIAFTMLAAAPLVHLRSQASLSQLKRYLRHDEIATRDRYVSRMTCGKRKKSSNGIRDLTQLLSSLDCGR